MTEGRSGAPAQVLTYTRRMGDASTHRRRALIEDARRDGGYLRATWHGDRRTFVVSTWRGDVCTGAVRLPVGGARDLVRVLVDGLADAAVPATETTAAQPVSGRHRNVASRVRAWLRRGLGRRPPAVARIGTGTRLISSPRHSA